MDTKTPNPHTVEATLEQGQLVLVVDRPSPNWKLDDKTREIGRKGVAQARAALRPSASHRLLAEAA